MKLKVLGSSSQGNCYILENDREALIIECGVKFDEIKKELDFNLRKVCGCLVSHEHKDHCKSVSDVLKAGIKVYATVGTMKAMETETHHNAVTVTAGNEYHIGSFQVLPFDTRHDAAQPCCFLIHHKETGNILFLTDTQYVDYTFRNLSNVIIEANFCNRIIDQKLATGTNKEFLRDRVLRSHMSLEVCKQVLRSNDLTAVNNIVLIHLSDSNSDADRFKKEVAGVTGKQVWIADKGLQINFSKQPF